MKEDIDYILLNLIKYYRMSGLNSITISFNNTIADRLLVEIIKNNRKDFDKVILECDKNKYNNLFKEEDNMILIKENKELTYRVSAKNKLYCLSFLTYKYDNNNLYPLYNYNEEQMKEMLSFYKINANELSNEEYGLPEEDLANLKEYLYNYTNFVENNNIDSKKTLKYLNQRNKLKTKIIPTLKEMQTIKTLY